MYSHSSNYHRNRSPSSRRDSSHNRQSRSNRTGSPSNNRNYSTEWTSSPDEFQYKGSNKQQWAKLQNKIKQRMMSQNIWYLEDKVEMARRCNPPPPVATIPPLPGETIEQKEDRIRQQRLIDDYRRKRETKFETYQDSLAIDYASAISAYYKYLSPSIQIDLNRAIEEITPATTDIATHFRVVKAHLEDKWGPNSEKDSEEALRKLALLKVDERGADVYLAAVFAIVDLLSKTPVRDSANNPIMVPVPPRPHLPRPSTTATTAELIAYIAADEADQLLWETLHPPNIVKNHRPTDAHIKTTVILALAQSSFTAYSNLANRYQQVDHATRPWADLKQDLQTLIQHNPRGTSRDLASLPRRSRHLGIDWHHNERPAIPPLENRYAGHTDYSDQLLRASYQANYHHFNIPRQSEHPIYRPPQDVRSASPLWPRPN